MAPLSEVTDEKKTDANNNENFVADPTDYFPNKILKTVEAADAISPVARPIHYPTIDILPWMNMDDYTDEERTMTARLVLAQAKAAGSFNFVGHGIEPEFFDKLDAATKAFFELPLETKQQYATDHNQYGYVANQQESASTVYGGVGKQNEQKDLREIYSTVYPPEAPKNVKNGPHQRELEEFMDKLQPVERALNRMFAAALNIEFPTLNLPLDYFHNAQAGATGCLRSSRYPKMSSEEYGTAHRLLAHSDWSTMTILYSPASSRGLEEIRHGQWVQVEFPPHTLHVTIGEVLCMWSNEMFANNIHRVSCEADANRISYAYFASQGLPSKEKDGGILPVTSLLKDSDAPAPKFPSSSAHLHMERYCKALFGK